LEKCKFPQGGQLSLPSPLQIAPLSNGKLTLQLTFQYLTGGSIDQKVIKQGSFPFPCSMSVLQASLIGKHILHGRKEGEGRERCFP